MMSRVCFALTLAFCLYTTNAKAWGEPVGMMIEPTYALPVPVYLKGGEDTVTGDRTAVPYTLDASINLHVPLTSSLYELEKRDGFAHSFVFIPRVDLRHGLAPSFPIRTPSYYPTVRFQFFHQRTEGEKRRVRLIGELLFAHLSNGQSGCLYRDQVDPDGARCRFPDGEEHVGAPLNHVDGSFASNELGLRAGLEWRQGAEKSALSLTGLLGVVFFQPTAGGLDPETEKVYGFMRTEAWLRVGKRVFGDGVASSEIGARVRADLRIGGADVQAPFGAGVDGFWCFDVMRDWGPFVRAYAGPDPYNVRFDVNVLVLGAGMMWEP